ncbi:MAG: hypothetical protein WCA79_00115 [Anaerolineales bacterium]
MKKKPIFVFWAVLSLIAVANLLVFDLLILLAPDKLRVQFVPDDAYYYLQLAKNFVKFRYWTFDSGLSVASGFHPLLAYLLSLIYKIFQPDAGTFVIVDVALDSIITILLVGWVWVRSFVQQNILFLVFLALCVSARSFLFNSVSGVEWPFVIAFTCIYCMAFYKTTGSVKRYVGIFITGLLLSLARTDTGLFPFTLFLAFLILSVSGSDKDKAALISSLSGLAGAITGLGIASLNTYLSSGNVIQSSARMKFYWSQFGNSPLTLTFTLPLRGIGFDYYFDNQYKLVQGIPFLCLCILLILLILRIRGHPIELSDLHKDQQTSRRAALFFASLACVLGYTILYTFDGVIQNWYTANFIVPVFILGGGATSYLQKTGRNKNNFAIVFFSLLTLITFFFNLISTYPIENHSPWPHQQLMLEAGKYLNHHPLDGRIGAWNAGIIGYYQGGTVVNLDGLVNDDIYYYAVNNSLPSYLEEKDIQYVVDFQLMFTPRFRQRGGYDNPIFLQKLKPVITFDQGQFPPWQFLTVYKISR